MKKTVLFFLGIFYILTASAQIIKLHEEVVKVPLIEGKVAFLKEIPAPSKNSKSLNFQKLKDWARDNYGKDPFISSVRYDENAYEIIAKSRIELLLPVDSKGVPEKFVMRYRINGYVFNDRCVLEVTDISYLYQGSGEKSKSLPKVIRAEDFITDAALAQNDDLKEIRANTKKSTLFFINQLNTNFEVVFGYIPTFQKKK